MRRARILSLSAFALLVPSASVAQSSLQEIDRLTRVGRTEEARVALMEWWEDDRADAPRADRQRALWLRGRLTVDPVQAELDFRRLLVTYPRGQFTPDAVLRLAQGAYSTGNRAQAEEYVALLRRDYSRSRARETADEWFAAAGPLPPAGDVATPTPTERSRAGQTPGESRPSERLPEGRTENPPTRRTDTTPRATDTDRTPPGADVENESANYSVQLGAFGEADRAIAVFEEVVTRGVEARIVRVEGSVFTHVRVGRFVARDDAVAVLEELTEMGINAALVRDDRMETPIRD